MDEFKVDQTVVNLLFGLASGFFGWVVNRIWESQKMRDEFEREITHKLQQVELLIAGDYVKKDEFRDLSRAIFAKLDKIENKIDSKVDK